MNARPRRLSFAVGTTLLTASLATGVVGCKKVVTNEGPEPVHTNEGPEPEPEHTVNEGPEAEPEVEPEAEADDQGTDMVNTVPSDSE